MSKSKGIGDSIEKITKATGIDWFVRTFIGDCGCDDRKAWLNQKFPYKGELTPEEVQELDKIFDQPREVLSRKDANTIFRIYNRVFHQNKKPKNCQSCNKTVIRNLVALYVKAK